MAAVASCGKSNVLHATHSSHFHKIIREGCFDRTKHGLILRGVAIAEYVHVDGDELSFAAMWDFFNKLLQVQLPRYKGDPNATVAVSVRSSTAAPLRTQPYMIVMFEDIRN